MAIGDTVRGGCLMPRARHGLSFKQQNVVAPPPGNGRNYAVGVWSGLSTNIWAGDMSGWATKPMDFVNTQTDQADSFWGGDGLTWTPTPASFFMSNQFFGSTDFAGMASGTMNSTWLSWLQAHSALASKTAIVRIWQECNGTWMNWSKFSSPSQFISAWRNMATQVRTVFPQAKIDWNLNYNCGPGSEGNGGNGTGYDLYPGDDLVDIISIDAYENGPSGAGPGGTTWANLQTCPGVNLTNLVSFATSHNKLIGVSETASQNCDSTWVTNWATWMDGLGTRASHFSWYDDGFGNNGGNVLWTTSGTADSCAASTLRAAWNACSFGTKGFTGTWTTLIPHT